MIKTYFLLKETFDNIEHLLEDVGKYANPSCNKIILGNKKDLESKREVNYQMAKVSSIRFVYKFIRKCEEPKYKMSAEKNLDLTCVQNLF